LFSWDLEIAPSRGVEMRRLIQGLVLVIASGWAWWTGLEVFPNGPFDPHTGKDANDLAALDYAAFWIMVGVAIVTANLVLTDWRRMKPVAAKKSMGPEV
jgi:hypothetical protein